MENLDPNIFRKNLNPKRMKAKDLLFDPIAGNFFAMFIGFTLISLSTYMNDDYGVWSGAAPVVIGVTASCFWIIRLHAYREAERIRLGKTIYHFERVLLRLAVALVIASVVHGFAEGLTAHAARIMFYCTLYIGGLFWLLFDFMLNYDRNLALFYVSKWYKTSWLDKLFNRDPRLWLISKFAIYLLVLYVYLKMFV
jgi:hypothetical protein